MEKMINELIEAAKKDRRGLIRLKNAAVTLGNFEFAAKLREIETKYHPETDEQKAAKKRAKELNLLFRMVDLNIPEDKCWLIEQTLKDAQKKKGKFSIDCATKLRIKEVEFFYNED